jgi:hypothetical protein
MNGIPGDWQEVCICTEFRRGIMWIKEDGPASLVRAGWTNVGGVT